MKRRDFLQRMLATVIASGVSPSLLSDTLSGNSKKCVAYQGIGEGYHPRAITMWDFSWLERRWPGAGYEDWDMVLDELCIRGYNAVRIDAYPHLVNAAPEKKWLLNEVWNQQVWGSPDLNIVQVQPLLNEFIRKCKKRDIKVALSSWYRQDVDRTYMKINSPEKLAEIWVSTLESIRKDDLLDNILYVDLCNEWPGNLWASFFAEVHPNVNWGEWYKPESLLWIRRSLEIVKEKYPDIPFLFSFDNGNVEKYNEIDTSILDLFEHHIWMVQQNGNEFYKLVDYKNGRFSPQAYKNVVKNAEFYYNERKKYWQGLLIDKINLIAEVAKKAETPLATTECWGIVDYKDWPLLSWDWVKELCEIGTITAAKTGMWAAIATSNFCGPQFVGMWRDVEWHKRLTSIIRSSVLDESLIKSEKANKVLLRL